MRHKNGARSVDLLTLQNKDNLYINVIPQVTTKPFKRLQSSQATTKSPEATTKLPSDYEASKRLQSLQVTTKLPNNYKYPQRLQSSQATTKLPNNYKDPQRLQSSQATTKLPNNYKDPQRLQSSQATTKLPNNYKAQATTKPQSTVERSLTKDVEQQDPAGRRTRPLWQQHSPPPCRGLRCGRGPITGFS